MALTSLNKEVTDRLFNMLSIDEMINKNELEIIKSNYSAYGKLEILAEQMNNLKLKAKEIIDNAGKNNFLHSIKTNIKLVPGTYYYHYKTNERDTLSIISPVEWNSYEIYYGKYLYNHDNIFYYIE